ncbi:MAG: integrase core domain-containing protein [Paracoccaceae bacterium]
MSLYYRGSQFTGAAWITTLTEANVKISMAERVIREWITFYNIDRPHTALDKRTPDEAYFDGNEMMKAA